jgi:hypothetical protein
MKALPLLPFMGRKGIIYRVLSPLIGYPLYTCFLQYIVMNCWLGLWCDMFKIIINKFPNDSTSLQAHLTQTTFIVSLRRRRYVKTP